MNNESIDIDGFQFRSLMTAWDEVFLCAVSTERRKTVVDSSAGI